MGGMGGTMGGMGSSMGAMGGMGGMSSGFLLSAFAETADGKFLRGPGYDHAVLDVRRFDFVIQFVWEETPPSKRKDAEDKKKKADDTAASPAAGNTPLNKSK